MPKFDVSLRQTLTIVGSIEITAKDEDDAQRKVQELLDNGDIPSVAWTVPRVKHTRIDAIEWEDQEGVQFEIEDVDEA
jgi:hypothetical protein